MKLTNLKITPKLGILVGVTLLGLCVAGLLAGYLMQREMLNARIEQTRAIVDMARNMALGLQKRVLRERATLARRHGGCRRDGSPCSAARRRRSAARPPW